MSFAAKYVPEGLVEFDESADWYETRQIGLGERYVAEVDTAIEVILRRHSDTSYVYNDARAVFSAWISLSDILSYSRAQYC